MIIPRGIYWIGLGPLFAFPCTFAATFALVVDIFNICDGRTRSAFKEMAKPLT